MNIFVCFVAVTICNMNQGTFFNRRNKRVPNWCHRFVHNLTTKNIQNKIDKKNPFSIKIAFDRWKYRIFLNQAKRSAVRNMPLDSSDYTMVENLCTQAPDGNATNPKSGTWQEFKPLLMKVSKVWNSNCLNRRMFLNLVNRSEYGCFLATGFSAM